MLEVFLHIILLIVVLFPGTALGFGIFFANVMNHDSPESKFFMHFFFWSIFFIYISIYLYLLYYSVSFLLSVLV